MHNQHYSIYPFCVDILCLLQNISKIKFFTYRFSFRAEEHEYLQFLLRVTEDIIINNYSKAEDIEKVFDYHIDVNKERLNMVNKKYYIIFLKYISFFISGKNDFTNNRLGSIFEHFL